MSERKRVRFARRDGNAIKVSCRDNGKRRSKEDAPASTKKPRQRLLTVNNSLSTSPYRAPFGEFNGTTIYRNRIVIEEEHRQDGHYCIEELLLPDCTAALCTTFHSSRLPWLTSVFGSIPHLTVVTASDYETQKAHVIGNALVENMLEEEEDEDSNNNQEEWYWVFSRPHTEGCFHSKVLLFRSTEGLRVVVSGNNLSKGQWTQHRDVFWAQDFPLRVGSQRLSGTFGYKLHTVLKDMMASSQHAPSQRIVNDRLHELFENVDFGVTRAQLVISFPRPGKHLEKTGYKLLARAVWKAMHNAGMIDDESSDDDDEEEADPGAPVPTPRLYATSGSFGDLKPDFLMQMYLAMQGEKEDEISIPKSTTWDECDSLVKALYPSVQTAVTMDMVGLISCMRHMPLKHLDTIPHSSLRRILHDAIPNPPTKQQASLDMTQSFHVATHGKFLYNNRGVLYVGSHNFSKNAWGLKEGKPKNVEIGVVLASRNETTLAEWKSRLPCQLVEPDARSPPSYQPYSGFHSIRKHHPLAKPWFTMIRKAHALRALRQLYDEAEEVLPGNDKWLIQTPLEGQTLEDLETMLHDYGPVIKESVKEARASWLDDENEQD